MLSEQSPGLETALDCPRIGHYSNGLVVLRQLDDHTGGGLPADAQYWIPVSFASAVGN